MFLGCSVLGVWGYCPNDGESDGKEYMRRTETGPVKRLIGYTGDPKPEPVCTTFPMACLGLGQAELNVFCERSRV